jgi:hypothetical protein
MWHDGPMKQIYKDSSLSWRARGIYMALEACVQEGYYPDLKALTTSGSEGQQAVSTALKELRDRGYAKRQRKSDGLTFAWSWTLDPEGQL